MHRASSPFLAVLPRKPRFSRRPRRSARISIPEASERRSRERRSWSAARQELPARLRRGLLLRRVTVARTEAQLDVAVGQLDGIIEAQLDVAVGQLDGIREGRYPVRAHACGVPQGPAEILLLLCRRHLVAREEVPAGLASRQVLR